MFYILCAVIFTAAVFGLGLLVGGLRLTIRQGERTPQAPAEQPVTAQAEKEAFALLMGYNAEVAYGLKSMKEE